MHLCVSIHEKIIFFFAIYKIGMESKEQTCGRKCKMPAKDQWLVLELVVLYWNDPPCINL